MSSSITQKVLIDLETSKATAEMKKLAAAGGNTADTIKALDAEAKKLEKSLGAIKVAAPTSTFTAFKGAMSSLGSAMTPLNQGLALAAKALAFAEEGVAAYAKTSAQAAKDVRALSDEFSHYKTTVLVGVGAAAVELGKSAINFEQAAEALRRGGEKGFGKAYGDITKQWNALNATMFDSIRAFDSLGQSLGATFGVITDKVAKNATAAMEAAVQKARALRAEMAALSNRVAKDLTDDLVARLERERPVPVNNSPYLTGSKRNSLFEGINEQNNKARTAPYLAAAGTYGSQLDVETKALQAFTEASSAAYEAIVTGSGSATSALKSMAKQQLLAFGVKEGAEAISQFAYGLGALANPLFAGSAAMHFASAAKHGAAAAIAGVGIGAIGAIGGGGSASSAPRSAGSSGGGSGGGGGGTRTIVNYVIVGDSHSDDSPRMRQRNAQRTLELAQSKTSAGRAE